MTGASLQVAGDKKGMMSKLIEKAFAKFYPAYIEDREIEHKILKKSDLEWTLVRLPIVIDSLKNDSIKVNATDISGSTISNYDIASFLIRQIHDDNFIHKTPFIAN